jgi:hypothetical protein
MWRLIAVLAISSLSLALTALPVYACTGSEQQTCNDNNTQCTNTCNSTGAPQSCYTACVCQYYNCMAACGDGMVPGFCRPGAG